MTIEDLKLTSLSNRVGGPVIKARYLTAAKQVAIDEQYLDILAESDDFLALFSRGKSVYKRGHSEYEPTRIYFCEIKSLELRNGESGEYKIELLILLESPIRKS